MTRLFYLIVCSLLLSACSTRGKEILDKAANLVGGVMAPVKLSRHHNDRGATDYNDLHRMGGWPGGGLGVVRKQIEKAIGYLKTKQKKDVWQCADIIAEDSDCRIMSRQARWHAGLEYWKDCQLDWIKHQTDKYTDGKCDWMDVEIEHLEEAHISKPEKTHKRELWETP